MKSKTPAIFSSEIFFLIISGNKRTASISTLNHCEPRKWSGLFLTYGISLSNELESPENMIKYAIGSSPKPINVMILTMYNE